jgi:hypothetical protein
LARRRQSPKNSAAGNWHFTGNGTRKRGDFAVISIL